MLDLKSRITGHGDESPDALLANPFNFRRHPREQRDALLAQLREIGWVQRVIVNTRTGHLIDGHLRAEIALEQNLPSVPVIYVDLSDDEERIALATLDPLSALANEDQAALDALIGGIGPLDNPELEAFLDSLTSDDDADPDADQADARESLQQRFLVPPFSVLDAKQGYWQDRKQTWLQLGINSELGRGSDGDKTQGGLTYAGSSQPPGVYEFKKKVEAELGRKLTWAEFVEKYPEEIRISGTSIFDPVLTEICYTWFCPPGGAILDPFAGGSVRGIVAGVLGYQYHGNDLRREQVEANRKQALAILGRGQRPKPSRTIPPIRITEHDGIRVVRDDDVFGGTKRRALARLLRATEGVEYVYASPAYGFAQVALAAAAADTGNRATIFVAARKQLHPRTQAAQLAGATIIEVEHGYLSHVQAKAKAHCDETGAQYVTFGLDDPAYLDAIAAIARDDTGIDEPAEVWTVAGSGMLTRALQQAWPNATFHAVQIGQEPDVGRATLHKAPEKFEQPARQPPPFESCDNYDAKAWRHIQRHASPGALFWNVAGNVQAFDLFDGEPGAVTWTVGDSRDIQALAPGEYDLLFSCPPYADLEVYSDDPADLSTLDYSDFIAAYRDIIARSCAMLRNDRFAVFVVGEVRNRRGGYYGFVQDTIAAFQDAGLTYYNEAVLLTSIGSNAMRASGMFNASRKLAKGHQNVLVFAKGEPALSDITGLARAVAGHFGEHRQVFQAFETILVFCKGDPKAATEALGDATPADLEALHLAELAGDDRDLTA